MLNKLRQIAVVAMAGNNVTRPLLNSLYQRLGPNQRETFHLRYSKVFRRRNLAFQDGKWSVSFLDKMIRIPLSKNEMWLDWDTAVSVVGHDIEVKTSYENLLRSTQKPSHFFDVGANYGTHSLLMASQGVQVIAFEPNAACVAKGKRILRANDLAVQWEHVAVGEERGTISLCYPEKETWLGTVERNGEQLKDRAGIRREAVKLVRLDDYISTIDGKRLLIKIDVEGLELEVLKGARRILAEIRPLIIFESNQGGERGDVFDILKENKYDIIELPWTDGPRQALTRSKFLADERTNFGATPTA